MSKKRKPHEFDRSFYVLAHEITQALEKNKSENLSQKEQVDELIRCEIEFKNTILAYKQSSEVYKKFLQRITVENNNILSARPYFRESAKIFNKYVAPAIKNKDIEQLKKHHINYQFVKFIRQSWRGPFPVKAESWFQKVHRARERLIENNMPLAINRAKLFYRKTPQSHLSLMDMIGICGTGLTSGIDKWVGEYSPVFRSVCIGRMVGNLIRSYSETMLHFYPSDRRIIYKANAVRGRQGVDNIKDLTAAVNKSFEEDGKNGINMPKEQVSVGELNALMAGVSMVSADNGDSSEDGSPGVYDITEDSRENAEEILMERETVNQILTFAKDLPTIHKKILKLKGIRF